MNPSVYRLTLDNHDSAAKVQVRCKKGENYIKLFVTLQEDGQPYMIASDCTIVFSAKKPDGTIILNNARSNFEQAVVDNNRIVYILPEQATTAPGEVHCEFQLIDGDGHIIVSPSFTLIVEERVYNGGEVESTSEYNALTQITALFTSMTEEGKLEPTKGDDGFSPTISMAPFNEGVGGYDMTIRNKDGEQTYTIYNGGTIGETTLQPLTITMDGESVSYDGSGSRMVEYNSPEALPNPHALTLAYGTTEYTYDGSADRRIEIPRKPESASSADTATKVGHALTLRRNGDASTDVKFDGSGNLTFNVSASNIGAADRSHTHTPASIGAAATGHTHTPASIGAAPQTHTHTLSEVGVASVTVNSGSTATVNVGTSLVVVFSGHNSGETQASMWVGRYYGANSKIWKIAGSGTNITAAFDNSGNVILGNTSGGQVRFAVLAV